MSKSTTKKLKKIHKIIITIITIISIIVSVYMYWKNSKKSTTPSGDLLYDEYDEVYTYLDKFTEVKASAITDYACRVHFIDVGQGDCMLVQLPDGKCMLIDAGPSDKNTEQAIQEKLSAQNITNIDYFLLTHQDADHVGSADYLFKNYNVLHTFRPYVLSTNSNASSLPAGFNKGLTNAQGGKVSTSKAYVDFLQLLVNEVSDIQATYEFFNKDTEVRNTINSKEYVFDFLTPTAKIEEIGYSDANDYSPIVLFSYCGVDVLFTGDAEAEVVAEYLHHYGSTYDIDILKVGHHGSYTSTTDAYLKALKPEYSVIQVGEDGYDKYRHPRQEVLTMLHENNSTIYRNDLNGDIVLTICQDGTFYFETELRADYQAILNGN